MKRRQLYIGNKEDGNPASEQGYEVPITSPEIEKAIKELSKTYKGEALQKAISLTYKLARLVFEISKK